MYPCFVEVRHIKVFLENFKGRFAWPVNSLELQKGLADGNNNGSNSNNSYYYYYLVKLEAIKGIHNLLELKEL